MSENVFNFPEVIHDKDKVVTVKELAEELHVAEQTVKNTIYELRQVVGAVFDNIERNSQGGYLLNEKQATVIKQELAKQDRSNLRSSDMKVRGQNSVKKQAEKTMTTKGVAEALGVSVDSVQNAAKALQATSEDFPKFTQGQRAVYNEAQVTAIKLELQNHSKVNALSPKTTLEKQLIIQQAMQLQAEMIAELEAENARQAAKIKEDAPKVEFYDAVTDSSDCIDIAQAAKVINADGIGRNKLFEILRKEKILDKNNVPYQKYVDRGYFRIIETSYTTSTGEVKISLKTLVFQKGLEFIAKIIKWQGKK